MFGKMNKLKAGSILFLSVVSFIGCAKRGYHEGKDALVDSAKPCHGGIISHPYSSRDDVQKTALAVSHAILEGRWSDLDGLLDSKFTYTGDGMVLNKDEYIGFMQDMTEAFSNLQMQFPHILIDEDQASIRFISTAVNTGSFMGAPANSRNLEVNGIFIRKVKDGKIMQEWQTTDLLGTMKQIGFGALFGYSVFVGLFDVEPKRPVRKFSPDLPPPKCPEGVVI